ncbi:MAG: TonB-dependent receptor [Gammaproteobacteria bacterium]|nr:TonB-dependent receptor [Gammaproteobacteria bacterium]
MLAMGNTAYAEGINLGDITVTGTREEALKAEIPASIGSVTERQIEELRPSHPSEIMNQIPGVHVNVTGGEGHMTAIRQPITTKALYLYLEDGIPTRSTGFFNHNAFYEVNVPQSGGVEVFKGPGTSLYGSDAIGGVINVMTRSAPAEAEAEANLELGEFGWRRLLLSGGNSWDDEGVRVDLNITHTDGWREGTSYDRQSETLRWDHFFDNGASLKTLISSSNIDQNTAGSSRLLKNDYETNPTLNYTPISFRKVTALRASVAYEKEDVDSLLSITPYVRDNTMELLPNWSLSYDPVTYKTDNRSIGMLVKYRQDFKPNRTRLVLGADIDHSPGRRLEKEISPTRVGNVYTSYTVVGDIYDYDVTYQGVSPYVHVETSLSERIRLTGGLRYDMMSYDYDNKLSVLTGDPHNRPADIKVDFSHLSPKLGITYRFNPGINAYASYRHAFRAPSEGQLFRQGKAVSTVDLKPIKVDSYELGVRGNLGQVASYEFAVYRMIKEDDILTYQYSDGTRETLNAGETSHRGIELGLGTKFAEYISLDVAYSYAIHQYEKWVPKGTVDYSGNEMESAPRTVANTRLAYRPPILNGGRIELEWTHLGEYWMDANNTTKYPGHDVFNLRANYHLGNGLEFYARVVNLSDKRYATAASYKAAAWGNPEKFEYAPGMPRTVYAGMNYRF